MPTIDKHAPGSFSWIELGTSDQTAAKNFYTSLLGWTFEDSPMGPNDFYTMFQLKGSNVGAGYTLREDERAMNVPPHWNLYIEVANADETAKKATEAGGTVLAAPFDVFNYGRMAVIQDPTGAVFCIWQAMSHSGFSVHNENASFCWADLHSKEADKAEAFYSKVFGWSFDAGADGYRHIKNGQTYIGGVAAPQHQNPMVPAHWGIYIQVDDCDAYANKAKELGARLFHEPVTMENVGRLVALMDPQGAAFSLFQPK